jgi:biotin carboxylase
MKNILIVGAGYFQVPIIKAAKDLGNYVIVTDMDENAPGMSLADEYHIISTQDTEGMLKLALDINKEKKLSAVLTMGTDVTHTVSLITDKLGLPGIKYQDALCTSVNKKNMRERFLDNNLSQPQFYDVKNLNQALNVTKYIGYPVVVKPVDSMGARGVVLANKESDMAYAFSEAINASIKEKTVLVEEYIQGKELSIDCLVYKGDVHFLCIGDRIIKYPPYFIEIGHQVPSVLDNDMIIEAKALMIKAIKALNITDGAAKGDIKVNYAGAFIGEIAGRLSGGFMSSHTLPLSNGIDAAKAAVKIALGEKPDLTPKFNKASVERAIIPKPGKIVSIHGIDEAKKIPGIKEIHLNLKEGDIVKKLKSNIGKAGNVISSHENLNEAIKIAEKALSIIKIKTEPIKKKGFKSKNNDWIAGI